MNNNKQDAIMDCKYALSLSETALKQQLNLWLTEPGCVGLSEYSGEDDKEYLLTLQEIRAKLHTNECLLKEGE